MTFKECVTVFLRSPAHCWKHYRGWEPAIHLLRVFLVFVRVVFDLLVGVVLCLGAPLFGPLLWVFMRATAEKRAAREAARQKAMDDDI